MTLAAIEIFTTAHLMLQGCTTRPDCAAAASQLLFFAEFLKRQFFKSFLYQFQVFVASIRARFADTTS